MYNASPARGNTPQHKQIPDGPIKVFSAIIEESKADEWNKRIKALIELVKNIPEGSTYSEGSTWFNTPAMLRHLALPISELLKDARSTVVKRTCEHLAKLFNRCQSDARYLFKDIMPTILAVHAQTVHVIRLAVQKMIMESIPEVPCKMIMPLWMERLKLDKSRTVREACALYLGQALMSWTEEGYLTEEIWMQVGTVLIRTLRDPSPDVRTNAKAALAKMRNAHPTHWDSLVNDPDGPAAKDAKAQKWLKTTFEPGRADQDELSVNSKSSFNSDSRFVPRVQRTSPARRNNLPIPLIAMPPSATSVSGAGAGAAGAGAGYMSTDRGGFSVSIPKSIAVTKETRVSSAAAAAPAAAAPTTDRTSTLQPMKRAGGLGPPLRRPFARAVESPDPKGSGSVTPPLPPPPASRTPSISDDDDHDYSSRIQKTISTDSSDGIPLTNVASEDASHLLQTALSTESTYDSHGDIPHFPSNLQNTLSSLQNLNAALPSSPRDIESSHSFELSYDEGDEDNDVYSKHGDDDDDDDDEDGAGSFIACIRDLKDHASKRRSRNSILMKERFRMSYSNQASSNNNSFGDDDDDADAEVGEANETGISERHSEEENKVPNNTSGENFIIDVTKTPTHAPEHMVIAIRLLRAHKEHVDTVMETLKVEMDTLRDFDNLLEETGRPTEEEVLDYFESLGLCLDQRTQSGSQLQREMDRISRGEPPRK
jgi:archaellum component FlaD/FlaE